MASSRSTTPDYQAGYSLARLRDVALTDLHGDQALNSTHIQQSLAVLFRVVNEGYEPEATLDIDARGLSFPGLGSPSSPIRACPMLDRARITDETLQHVLANLCFTREQKGRTRQSSQLRGPRDQPARSRLRRADGVQGLSRQR